MKVLIAVDGSACSDRAVSQFIEHLTAYKERPEVHLLHVHPPIPMTGRTQGHIDRATLEHYYREEGEACMATARGLLDNAGIPYVPHLHVGRSAEAIAKEADSLGCDLIAMGAHGHGMVSSILLGSVVGKVLGLTTIPVLVLR